MTTVNVGIVSPVIKGSWDDETEYNRLNIVHGSDGATYQAIQTVPAGTALSNTSYWMQITPKGLTLGTITEVGPGEADASIGGTSDAPTLNLAIPRGVAGNESIDDTKGEGDTDYVFSADQNAKYQDAVNKTAINDGVLLPVSYASAQMSSKSVTAKKFGNRVVLNGTSTGAVKVKFTNALDTSGGAVKEEWQAENIGVVAGRKYKVCCTKVGGTVSITEGDTGRVCELINVGADSSSSIGGDIDLLSAENNVPLFSAEITATATNWTCILLSMTSRVTFTNCVLVFSIIDVTTKKNPGLLVTDTTLTVPGIPADSEMVGQNLDSMREENLVWNTLVPNIKARYTVNGEYELWNNRGELSATERGFKLTALSATKTIVLYFGENHYENCDNTLGLEPGNYYTISGTAKVKLSGYGKLSFYFPYDNSDQSGWDDDTTFRNIVTIPEGGAEVEEQFSITFFVPADKEKMYFRINFGSTGVANLAIGDYFEIRDLMLQKGQITNPWKPNPHDLVTNRETEVADDPDMDVKIQQLKRKTRKPDSTYATAPLVLLHFSDIHGDGKCLQNIVNFRNKYGAYIDDVIHTGDIVRNLVSQGIEFWDNVDGAENILNCIGNHDTRTDSDTWIGLTMKQCYDTYYAPYVSNWGAECDEDTTYYYKDYPEQLVRLIVLDSMHLSAEQLSWFTETLTDALENQYHVIVANHVRAHWLYTPYSNLPWDDTLVRGPYGGSDGSGSSAFPTNLPDDYASAVDTFIASGGNFICWITGHSHYKIFAEMQGHNNQLNVSVANAGFHYAANSVWERVEGTKSEDDFNVIGIDTYAKILRIAKVGVNYDRMMRKVDTISYNYETHTLLYSN